MVKKILISVFFILFNINACESSANPPKPRVTIGFNVPLEKNKTAPYQMPSSKPRTFSSTKKRCHPSEADDDNGLNIRYNYYSALAKVNLLNPPHKEDMRNRLVPRNY